jgi:hypothetical protein
MFDWIRRSRMKTVGIAQLKPKMRFCVAYRSQNLSYKDSVFEVISADDPRVVANCVASAPVVHYEVKNPVVFDKKAVRFLLPTEEYVNALLKGDSE